MSIAQHITSCEICGNPDLPIVLDLGKHPLCDDLVPVNDTRVCEEYPIEILFCDKCISAHQKYQVPKRELFPQSYHYRSRFTKDVLEGMSMLVDACEAYLGTLKDKLVLDVGCNDGSLLDFFKKKGAKTIGVEPTSACADAQGKGHELIHDYFDVRIAREIRQKQGSPDVITFTNVFAHIENLPELLNALRELISPKTLIVVENHYLGAVLDRNQFDTFYHEHPRTYSLTSFQHIARSLGMELVKVEFPARYGGNIRVFMGGAALGSAQDTPIIREALQKEASFKYKLGEMQANVKKWQAAMTVRLKDLVKQYGPLPAKAFPGRAAILIKLLGIDKESISHVHEKPGSMKIGHYLPGTRIPIISDDEFIKMSPKPPVMLNLAWHISIEINKYLRGLGYTGEIVDILDPKDIA